MSVTQDAPKPLRAPSSFISGRGGAVPLHRIEVSQASAARGRQQRLQQWINQTVQQLPMQDHLHFVAAMQAIGAAHGPTGAARSGATEPSLPQAPYSRLLADAAAFAWPAVEFATEATDEARKSNYLAVLRMAFGRALTQAAEGTDGCANPPKLGDPDPAAKDLWTRCVSVSPLKIFLIPNLLPPLF